MILLLYRFIVVPVAVVALPFLALFQRKIRSGLGQRLKPVEPARFSERPIWIHAASGEFEYAKSVIRELKRRAPSVPILVTYFSPTFSRQVKTFPGVDLALPLPLDLPGPCASFLKRFKPRVWLLARTDFWPEMLHQAQLQKIPVVVFSYTHKSRGSSGLKNFFVKWKLAQCSWISCVSDEDKAGLDQLHLNTPVYVLGDSRYDQVEHRLQAPTSLDSSLRPPPDRPCMIAGSTWDEDEEVLLPAVASLLKAGRLRLVLVPHEPTPQHIRRLTDRLRALGLTFDLLSANESWPQSAVLVIDRVGLLAELYAWGDFAFIGGSFKGSVHSVMEALGAGCRTYVGPYYKNNREALEFEQLQFAGLRGIQVARSAEELASQLEQDISHSAVLPRFKSELKREFLGRLGGSAKLVEKLSPWLTNP